MVDNNGKIYRAIGSDVSRRGALALFGATTAAIATSCVAHPTEPTAQKQGAVPPDAYELNGSVDGYRTKLVLLGTAAGPLVNPGRSGMASAVIVGDQPYLIDAGPWSSRKLVQAGISADSLRGVFITHLHNDHIADLFNIFWLPGITPVYNLKRLFSS